MKKTLLAGLFISVILGLSSCAVTPKDGYKSHRLDDAAEETIFQFEKVDPGIGNLFKNSVGYAVFPTVGAGAVGVGGAYGKGQVYEGGRLVGYCDLTQASLGIQLGGQAYSQVIFFNSRDALDWFKSGDFSFSGQASAVALDAGVSANANFRSGVAVYTLAKGGLMYQASIGGQKFRFEPTS